MFKLLLLFVLIPLIELALLSQLLAHTNIVVAVAVVLTTGMIGFQLARWQGMEAWRAIHQQVQSGKTPSREILNGVMVLIAGAFLITPGLLTDVAGFTLLIPRCRMWLGARCMNWFKLKTVSTFQTNQSAAASPFEPVSPEDDEAPTVRVIVPETEQ